MNIIDNENRTVMEKGLWISVITFLSRVAFAGLLVFELLNEFDIFHYSLDFTWFGLMITSGVIWITIEVAGYILRKKYNDKLTLTVALSIGAIMVYIDALGDIFHFYSQFPWYDRVAHFAGGIVVATAFACMVKHLVKVKIFKLGTHARLLFVVAVSALGGCLYEIEEYLEDYFTGSKRLGNGPDTADDMMLIILGAILAALIIEFTPRLFKKLKKAKNSEEKVKITIE